MFEIDSDVSQRKGRPANFCKGKFYGQPRFVQGPRGSTPHRPHNVDEAEPFSLFNRRLNANKDHKRARDIARAQTKVK